jgi:hypothetical protein
MGQMWERNSGCLQRDGAVNCFSCGDSVYDYALFTMNEVYNSERTIELPVIEEEVKHSSKVLEVGNVLKQYFPHMIHTVVDKYEIADGVINQDILDYEPDSIYDLVVSISTVEHIGFDEPVKEHDKAIRAIEKIRSLGKRSIITFPMGYNPYLDNDVKNIMDAVQVRLMKRVSPDNRWIEVPVEFESTKTYNSPFKYGNWVLFMEFGL